jgi:hypothetical protein
MDMLLCYFYSTIPQILSGTIGLFGVFCLYKLNLIRAFLIGLTESMAYELEINEAYAKLKENNSTKERFDMHIRRLKIAAIQSNPYKMQSELNDTDEFVKQFMPGKSLNKNIIAPFEDQMKTRNKLIKDTRFALIYTGILIFISVFIIPFIRSILIVCPYPTITKYNCLAVILLIIMITLFLINLIIIIKIVFQSLDTHHEIKNI